MTPQDPLSDRLRALARLYEEEMPAARSEQIAARAVARAAGGSPGVGLATRRVLALSAVGIFTLVLGVALGMLADQASPGGLAASGGQVTIVGSKYAASQEQLHQAIALMNQGRGTEAVPLVRQALAELKLPSTAALAVAPSSTTGANSAATSSQESQTPTPQVLVLRLAAEHLLRVIQTVEETDGDGALAAELEQAAANVAEAAEDVEEAADTTTTSSTSTTTRSSTSSTTTTPSSTTTTSVPDGEDDDPIILPPQP